MALLPFSAKPGSGGGGGGTPGGSNTQVQFNDSGNFGGDANFTWDKTNKIATFGAPTVSTSNYSLNTWPTTAARNNFTGSLGFTFKVTQPITVSQLGRLYVAGNSQNHVVNLWISTNTSTPIATGTILNASTSDSNNFKWVSITPVTLTPGNTYALAIDETNGGDTWKDKWTPDSNTIVGIVSAYTGSQSTYPSSADQGSDLFFDTPVMKFSYGTNNGIITGEAMGTTSSYWAGTLHDGLGRNYLQVRGDGKVFLGNSLYKEDSTGQVQISTGLPTNKGLIVQGSIGQSANLQEWQIFDGTVTSKVAPTGIYFNQQNPGAAVFLGGLPGAADTYAGMWLAQSNPSTSNYLLLGTSTDTFINAASATIQFRVGNTPYLYISTQKAYFTTTIEAVNDIKIDNGSFLLYLDGGGSTIGQASQYLGDFYIDYPGHLFFRLGYNGTVGMSFNTNGQIDKYRQIATTGWGVPAIYGTGRSTAQTAAVASVANYTVGAADGSFLISGNVNVTASTTHSFSLQCDYTDETNTSRTVTLNVQQLGGTLITAITNVTGTGPYEGVPLHIRCKASTAITIKTTGTFTSVTYNVEGSITQIA